MARILIVDDSPTQTYNLSKMLEKHGHEIITAENGEEGVDTAQTQLPDLILMDVSMPEMNGLDATLSIREIETETGGHVPIIGLTAHALKGDRELCLETGMDDYLPKPIDIDALLTKIDRLITAQEH